MKIGELFQHLVFIAFLQHTGVRFLRAAACFATVSLSIRPKKSGNSLLSYALPLVTIINIIMIHVACRA